MKKIITAVIVLLTILTMIVVDAEDTGGSVAHDLIGGDLRTKRELYENMLYGQFDEGSKPDWIERFIQMLCANRCKNYEYKSFDNGEAYIYSSGYKDAPEEDRAFFTNLINGEEDIVNSIQCSDLGIQAFELYYYAYQIAYHFSDNRQIRSYYMRKCLENTPGSYDSIVAMLDGFANYVIRKENPEVDLETNAPIITKTSVFCDLRIAYELSEDDVQDLELLLNYYYEYYKKHVAEFLPLNEYRTNYLEIYLILQTYYHINNMDSIAREHIPYFDRIMYRAQMDDWTRLCYNTLSYGLKALFDKPLLRKRDANLFYSNYYYRIIFSEFDKGMEKNIKLLSHFLNNAQ